MIVEERRPSIGCEASPAQSHVKAALNVAVELLAQAQEPDGRFPMAPTTSRPPGGPGDDLFSTATVLALAAGVLPPDLVDRAATYLLKRRGDAGLWAWGVDGALPPDSDDTACCLGALAEIGVPLDGRREARVLRRFWRWGGPFRTWLANGDWAGRDRDDAVVNCNVLWALRALGVPPRAKEVRAAARLVAAQQGATRYYCSPASVAWAAARVGLVTPALRPPREAELCGRALECAQWALAGWVDARSASAVLLGMREADGGWTPEPWVQDHRGAWESRSVTLAFAIAALQRVPHDP